MLQQSNNNTENASSAQPKEGPQYVTTVRDGAIGAGIFLATRKDGTQGHFFKLSRAYRPNEQESFQYSDRFYARNSEAIAKVATEASKKCSELDTRLGNGSSPG